MAKIYNLRNNKQNNKTQATQPVSLSLADRIIKAITPTVAKTAAKTIKSKGELNVPTRGTDISTPSVFNNKNKPASQDPYAKKKTDALLGIVR